MRLNEVCQFLDAFAPTDLAEDWDNVGLLAGDPDADVKNIMTCLTVTPESANEAINKRADLVVAHHPLPFRAIKKVTTQTTPTKLLWQLIRNGVAIYSPHTGFDSAIQGINQTVCERLGLKNIKSLVPQENNEKGLGAGRFGQLTVPVMASDFIELLKEKYAVGQIRYVGKQNAKIAKVASACGSGGSFLDAVVKANCDTLLTGEADFHSCLEAAAQNVTMILLGHYTSERFAIEMLADKLSEAFNDLEIWASKEESDPIVWS